ncbi:MAG: SDR family NAD(P)-dependent oxidoreductase [Acidobacteria bacterium]|nr:SDR family NAD(P)-dependent oxidoreductase [Acidobacteriota bacterium]
MSEELQQETFEAVAVVGMAGRFPGAANVEEFWRNLRAGVESISFFTDEELGRAGVPAEVYNQPNYVRARGRLADVEQFDAPFFGFNPREAEIMDPQHRVFLECAWEALEAAGYDPERVGGPVGVFGGASLSAYLFNLYSNPEVLRAVGGFQAMVGNDKDHLCTRVSYKLNLSGPSLSVQTACSTSLVAVSLACQSLLNYQCDMALAGGVSIALPQEAGYAYQEGGVTSPDGHCRAFDERALGTLGGNGAGVVLLKRLSEAVADGDQIHAVIKGTAVNNDGSAKVGYTAPSVTAQAEVIALAQAVAGVAPETVSYVEAHGTGTPLGDPIEVAALTRAFRHSTGRKNFCALGSVKTNVGHLDAAAGVAGLLKTVLALKHRELPPSLHFERPNPKLEIEESPFYVNARLSAWERGETPRRAGVSSFGIGGTNAHVVLEEAPEPPAPDASRPYQLLLLSARTPSALAAASANLAAHLKGQPDINLADAAYTLQEGRKVFAHRRALVCRDAVEAVSALGAQPPKQAAQGEAEGGVAFMFPGQGAQHVNMARELYETEATFRETLDACALALAPHLGEDLRRVLFPAEAGAEAGARRLAETQLTQPAVFAVEYALAKLWMSWGVVPTAMIGHSVGEYVAACLAGVLSLEDALRLVAVRGRLMGGLPRGAMTAVPLPAEELRELLGEELSLAAHNAPSLSVASGPVEAVERLERQLAASGLEARRLHTSHAFHSRVVEPVLAAFAEEVARVELRAPSIPFVSNVTGRWIEASEATDPAYWARHLRQAVLFLEGVETLLAEGGRFLLEVGPGQTLTSLVRRHPSAGAAHTVAASLPHPQANSSAAASVLGALGKLWVAGVRIDWRGFYGAERRRRVQLPTYPFERSRYWVERRELSTTSREEEARRRRPVSEWFYTPTWKRDAAPRLASGADEARGPWLVLAGGRGLGEKVLNALRRRGREAVLATASGAGFARKAEGVYEIDARRQSDYVQLLDELSARGLMPTRILHLGAAAPAGRPERAGVEGFERAQGQVFYSLLHLAQALGGRRLERSVRLGVVTFEAQEVFGEREPRPEQATVHGLCRVIPQEYPDINCRSIDVSPPAAGSRQEEELIDALIGELSRASTDAAVALRGGRRWVQSFEPTPLEAPPAGSARLRERGVYLITGGTGGVGLVFAEYLARAARARLVLTARTEFPARGEWEARAEADDEFGRKIAKLRELESLGAEVLVCRADASDPGAMRAALARAEATFGPVNGVVHAAGVVGPQAFSLIQGTDEAACRAQFRAKAHGTLVLEEVLRGRDPDFCMLVSSLSTVLGGIGFAAYASANAFMDAFAAAARGRSATVWTSVAWDGWRVGAAGEAAADAITPAEGLEALARLFTLEGGGALVVSTTDLGARVRQWVTREESGRGAEADGAGAATFHPRPELENEYVGPRDEVEEEVASIWRDLLGLEEVGIHDNFFELGGHSLLATHLIARLREIFHVEVPVSALFETPTVVDLAGFVRQAAEAVREDVERTATVLELIEFLSEDEARALLSNQS